MPKTVYFCGKASNFMGIPAKYVDSEMDVCFHAPVTHPAAEHAIDISANITIVAFVTSDGELYTCGTN
ncbi:hypothetical protein ADUPG1_006926, partial [Aduncisulcus paluster]